MSTPYGAAIAAPDRTAWFVQARFGLFVHWGLYALPARSEWVRNREKLSRGAYRRYFENFRADLYSPGEWAAAAKAAGMRYAILTAKHHEGFCLWDSALTDYKVTNTPAARDVVAEFVEAFRAEGFRVGLYYSLIDWHHPDFPLDVLHPDWSDGLTKPRGDIERYAEYLHGQVRELLTTYQPDTLWFDFSYPKRDPGGKGRDDWQSERLVAMVRELCPDILLNDRLDLPGSEDFVTPEGVSPHQRIAVDGRPVPWELCKNLNGSWGYAPNFEQWLDAGQGVRLLVDCVSKGGNLLLNVGPTGRGQLEPRARELLAEIGAWISLHGDAIYGAGASPLTPPPDCRLTQVGNRLFIHVFAWPASPLVLEGLTHRIKYASLLHDGSEVAFEEVSDEAVRLPHTGLPGPIGSVTIDVPLKRPDVLVPVIELVLDPAGSLG